MVRRKGQSLTATFDTEAAARKWADATEARLLNGARADQIIRAPSSQTVADVFERYRREVSPHKGGARWEVVRLRALAKSFQVPVADLDGAAIAEWRDERVKQVSTATVNRELNLISAVLTRAIKEWRIPLQANPVFSITRPKQPPNRTRRVSDAERAAVMEALGWSGETAPTRTRQWIAWSFCLALETMMRQGEILRLTWEHVYLDRRYCHLPKTKNGHPRNVPLSSKAIALFGLLPQRPSGKMVPVHQGTFVKTFRDAVRESGIVDLHFHDTRREALTRTSKKLSNVAELARASGHKTLRALMVYYEPDPTDIAEKMG